MSRKPTKSDPSDVETQTEEIISSQPATTNMSPGKAAELMSATVLSLRQQWLQSAVTLANTLKNGQTVHRASFEDLRQLRENYEELERARIFLRKIDVPVEGTAAESEQKDGN